MTRRVLNIAVLSILVVLASCKKSLVEKPLTQVPVGDYFKSLKDVNAAMSGIYVSFQTEMIGDGVSNVGGKYHYWGEGRSDNFDRSQYSNVQIRELALNQISNTNSTADWSGLYRTINRINQCILNIPLAAQIDNNVTPTIVNNDLAQCYALRAECYFYLTRIWGDVVVFTEPYTDITQPAALPRTPKDKVISDVILADLTKAYSLIQKSQTPNIYYINEGAICAIMADVYMWKKDYPNAIVWYKNLFKAKGVTAKLYAPSGTPVAGDLETQANWKNAFLAPNTSVEAIWSIFWNQTIDGCACIPISVQNNNNPIRVDSLITVRWKANKQDTRVLKTIDTLPNTGHVDKVYKYYNLPATGLPAGLIPQSLNVFLPMYRMSDAVLGYAEALNYTGDKTTALAMLNLTRVRAGYTALAATDASIATQETFEDVILQERQWELFGEGKRWFDIVRTNRVNKIMDPFINYRQKRVDPASNVGFGTDLNKILWPILRQNLEDNPQLVQNPSYF
ncbi:RagB/SusD family nutrient uptake outer membrane protein [Mucilaginibacter mali]|uniref:RagB/SusD family nutrient uptake outer membrane protein n=1 Tax=Mucilaginibacter mali TaxID=2740462 RepID=A0A7D4Q3M8_9SPHI|nr:RagB/SusD family nutrient uptake outer membrane protein [Mucilaginibacter mali]QKJ32306.1 RagB/SusD family nutrient uptake outer membrane protein [Mucilaginibacter mali]